MCKKSVGMIFGDSLYLTSVGIIRKEYTKTIFCTVNI